MPTKMPQYRCHKIVGALQIKKATRKRISETDDRKSAVVEFKDPAYAPREMPHEWAHRFFDQCAPGAYLVEYQGGYVSVSPQAEFEAGYALIEVPATIGNSDLTGL